MEFRFLALTAALSALTFSGVWMATGPARADASAPVEVSATPPATSVYYSGCHEARAAGVTPLHRGEPGYREGMDGDGDGIACEDYAGSSTGLGSGGSFRRRGRR